MKNILFYDTVIGQVGIAEQDGYITNIFFNEDVIHEDFITNETEVLKVASGQLYEYLSGKRKNFSLPLAPQGTAFMKQVWQCLTQIPYGETRSYKEIAAACGNPKASRAVGMANNRNPIPVIIPCHRVIGSTGKLIGYRGGLVVKQKLMEIEKNMLGRSGNSKGHAE